MTKPHLPRLLVASVLLVLACGGKDAPTGPTEGDAPTPIATTLTISETALSLSSVGATAQLTATVLDQTGATMSGASVSWASSDTDVAAVSTMGLVTAVATGMANITATLGSLQATAIVTVVTPPIATTLTISETALSLSSVGATAQLTATVLDQTGATMSGASVSWASSDTDVAAVSTMGLVTAVATGMANITATLGSLQATAIVTVVTPPIATTLTISETALSLSSVGATAQLTATVLDQTGATMSGASVSWASSDTDVAAVSTMGLVTAVATGMANITATLGSLQATAIVTVVTPPVSTLPPFGGTIFIDPDIITSSDPTTFQNLSFAGQGARTMFDRRVNDWITVDAYLFNASFDDGLAAEIQVNPEFGGSDAALAEAEKYAEVIGRLPTALRNDVETVWIHKGTQPFGGGNNNLLIHIGQADLYTADGILEETFVHEAAHTSLDAAHASAPAWLAAQSADPTFISTYARDFPNREDIAESFLPYLAIRYRSDRISQSLANTIMQTMPNRIAYFDNQSFDMYPIQ